MPKVKDGYRQIGTQGPVDVLAEMEELAERNGRSFVEELAHAMRRHLASPPTVRVIVEEPPLEPAEISPPKPKGRGRGRPKKEK